MAFVRPAWLSPKQMSWRLALRLLIGVLLSGTAFLPVSFLAGFVPMPGELLVRLLVFLLALNASVLGIYASVARRTAEESAKRALIESLYPAFKVGEPSEELQEDRSTGTCVVCLEDACPGDTCRRLECGHSFHATCIDAWWLSSCRRRFSCPLCRDSAAQTPVADAV